MWSFCFHKAFVVQFKKDDLLLLGSYTSITFFIFTINLLNTIPDTEWSISSWYSLDLIITLSPVWRIVNEMPTLWYASVKLPIVTEAEKDGNWKQSINYDKYVLLIALLTVNVYQYWEYFQGARLYPFLDFMAILFELFNFLAFILIFGIICLNCLPILSYLPLCQ